MDSLINKAQKLFKTDIRYLLRGGFWLTSLQIAASGMSLMLAIAFAHFVPKEIYGNYKYLLSIAGILSAFTLSGLNTSLIQSIAKGFDDLKKVFWINLYWNSFFVAIAGSSALYYFIHKNTTLAIALCIIGIINPLIQSASLFDPYLIGKKDFKTNGIFGVIDAVFPPTCIFITILIHPTVLTLLLVYFISNAIASLFFYILTLQKYKPSGNFDPTMITYAKHLSIINILNIIIDNMDQVLIFHFLGAAQLALYSFAVALPEQIKGFLKNISSLALPKLAPLTSKDTKKAILTKTLILLTVIACIIIIYILLAPFIFTILFPKYVGSIIYSQLFAVSLLGSAAILPLSALQAHSQKKQLYYINIGSSIVQISTLVVLIYFYGIIGAIIARIVTRYLTFIFIYILFTNYSNKNPL